MGAFSMRGVGATIAGGCSALLRVMAFAGAMLVAGQATAATVLTEDFSGGLNAWFSIGGEFGLRTDGGPAGAGDAYMFTSDNADTAMTATFGNGWTGDLSAYDSGTLSFDFLHETLVKPELLGSFGRIEIFGTSGFVRADAYGGAPASSWVTTALAFDAATFNTTQANWLSILGDVTSITLRLESWSGNTEVVGLDNVRLAPVPLPASVLLLLGGLGMMFALRRHRAIA